ncbi:MAG: tRNA pseudouridine(55) synthase TruB [Bacteroidales bacterium]|nr:tRNA pseudouridine(55) synthase TruB [Bacteroidales bacterium]
MTESLSHNIEDYPEGIILPIDKPYRWTSADVIRKVKYAAIRHFGKKNLKVGHAGTLDPLATGILLVCIGPATKKAEELQKSRKQYIAGISFGATTPSYDLEKDIDKVFPTDGISKESIAAILPSFIGEQDQVAPLFSAKSVDGVRVYETARRMLKEAQSHGISFRDFQKALTDSESEVILQANRINIYDLTLESFSPELKQDFTDDGYGRIRVADVSGYRLPTAMVRVDCSKGTYIRALARDLGEALGSGAFLSSLRRTSNGGRTIEEALSLDAALRLFK